MQKYELDLETLLSLLEEMRQNGILLTNVPAGFLGQKVGCQVRIDVVAGKVAYCHIEDSEGRVHVLGSQKAFSLLYGMGPLEWFVETHLPEDTSLANTNSSLPNTRPLPNSSPYDTRPLPNSSPYDTVPLPSISSVVPRAMLPATTRPFPAVSSQDTIPLWRMSSIVPRQIINIEPRVFQSLSLKQRRVLVLVDGTRNIENIASVLYSSPQDSIQAVLMTLRELESLGLIAMGR